MATGAMESPDAYALQLRRLLDMGPLEGDHGAATLAETIVTQLTARVPLDAHEAITAKRLILDLRGFFLGPRPFSHAMIVQSRNHFTRRIKLLHRAVARYG